MEEIVKIKFDSVMALVFSSYEVKIEEYQNIEIINRNVRNLLHKGNMEHGKIMRSQKIENVLSRINFKYKNEQVHMERVGEYCSLIGKAMNLSTVEVENIRQAGKIHDIGKIVISPELLNKKESLTDDEFELIKKHSEIGYHILKSTDEYAGLAEIVRYHHERFDGNGYPDRLRADGIPLESRIVALADSYEAMTSNRSYQKSKSKKEALLEIKRCSGTQFDPKIVEVFLKLIKEE